MPHDQTSKDWTRRHLLLAMSALVGTAPFGSWAHALGPDSKFDVAELVFSGVGPNGQSRRTLSRPNAWKRMLYEVIQSTALSAIRSSLPPKIRRYLSTPLRSDWDGALPEFTDEAAANRALLVLWWFYRWTMPVVS